MLMLKNLNPVWDLDSIFPGGSSSPQLDAHLRQVAADIESLQALIPAGADREQWRQFIDKNQDVAARLRQAGAFIGCLDAQNTKDKKAKLLAGRVRQLYAALSSVQAAVDEKILAMDD